MEVYTRPGKEEKQRSKDPYGSIFEEKTSENAMPGKTIWRPLINQLPKDAPDRIEVDWEALQKKNEDLIAWILIPSVEISYPVLQGDDNEYYLHRDFNREYLYAGSIFMDKDNSPSFINYNTILYGHNMRDGSMFAGLKDFLDVGAYQLCRYFWVLTPEADLLYEIFAARRTMSGSSAFTVRFATYGDYKTWQDEMLSLSGIGTGIRLDCEDRIVTLSTCTDDASMRMIVQGKLVWKTS